MPAITKAEVSTQTELYVDVSHGGIWCKYGCKTCGGSLNTCEVCHAGYTKLTTRETYLGCFQNLDYKDFQTNPGPVNAGFSVSDCRLLCKGYKYFRIMTSEYEKGWCKCDNSPPGTP